MRRTTRALSAVALAGAVLGSAAPAAFAEPAAEVDPSTVSPGGSITVSVACDPTGGSPPDTIDATSQAFEAGTVRLKLVPGNDDEATGPAYSGTARIAAAANFEGGPDAVGGDSAWTVDGTCPVAPGGQGKQWSATFDVSRGSGGGSPSCTEPPHAAPHTEPPHAAPHTEPPHAAPHTEPPRAEPHTEPRTEPHADSCTGAAVQRGVRAGQGGAFTESVPALVTGGLLIAGAVGAAVYRLRRRTPQADV